MRYEAVVIGVSAGGFEALKLILPALPGDFAPPVIIVQHVGERSDDFMAEYLNRNCALTVKAAEDKEPIAPNHVYLAPAGYHLLIEEGGSFSLSADSRVNFSCPAIDVLFESAADAFADSLIGVVLTGANADGAKGLAAIGRKGGLTVVQNPESADSASMPRAAIAKAPPDYIVELTELAPLLIQLCPPKGKSHAANR